MAFISRAGLARSTAHVFVEPATSVIQFDNQGEKSIVDVELDSVHGRQCFVYGLNIDGS